MRRALAIAVIVVASAGMAGCGGGDSPSDRLAEADAAAAKSDRAYTWSSARFTLAGYCVKQAEDGTGSFNTADILTDRMIDITRRFPDEEYGNNGTTYRQELGDQASRLARCDPLLAEKVDRAIATLDDGSSSPQAAPANATGIFD